MSDESREILKEIRNLLEFQIRQTIFGSRTVPTEGGLSWEEQDAFIERRIARIKKEGR